jgi:hypothetical protein
VSDSLPRIDHVRSHLPPRVRPLLETLLRADTHDEIARSLGYWSRRQVDYAVESIRMTFAPDYIKSGPTLAIYGRMRALRVAAGLDPCWCELSTEYPQEYSRGVRHLVGNSATGHKNASENGGSPARHPTKEGGAPMTLLRAAR